MAGERTEAPTPKRLKDARQKGNVAKSEELVTIGVLFLAVSGLKMLGPQLWGDMETVLHDGLAHPTSGELTSESAFQMGKDSAWQLIAAMLPLLGLLAIGAVIFNIAQTGLLLSGQGLKPNMNRLNPGSGLKRLISMDGLMRLGKSLFKFTVVSVLPLSSVWVTSV